MQDLSQSWHAARSAASKRGAKTKKVLKTMRTAEEERVWLVCQAYCHGDDGTHRRGVCGSRTSLSLHRFMLQTRSVAEASSMVVDGMCVMLQDNSLDS